AQKPTHDIIERNGLGKHYIIIKLAAQQPDKFLLLEEGKDKSTLDKPEEYIKHIWRVGKILVTAKL
ncbi:MAG: hypothetical protein H7320_12200, partial [Ferruginibacter sp.]|nr:hypothetical protein [Ferruginibacter sp.]